MYPCVRGCLSFQNIRCRGAYHQSLFFILNFYTMASASGTALNICNTLVLQLDEPKKGLPNNWLQTNGFYSALTSAENRAGYERELAAIREDLKNKVLPNTTFPKVQFKFLKPDCSDQTVTSPTAPCDSVAVGTDLYDYVNITVDRYQERKFTITRAQFDSVCYGKDSYLADTLRREAKGVLRDMNKVLGTQVTALMGAYSDGVASLVTPVTLPLFNTTGGINASGLTRLETEYFLAGATGGDITTVGGIDLRKYNSALGLSAINSTNGTDASKLSDFPFYFDTSLAKNVMITWQNTTIQLLEAYRYEGERREFSEAMIRTTMPIDGVEFDMSMFYDPCVNDGSWTVTLSKRFGLGYIPTADYTCMPEAGMNAKLKFLVGCGAMDCAALDL